MNNIKLNKTTCLFVMHEKREALFKLTKFIIFTGITNGDGKWTFFLLLKLASWHIFIFLEIIIWLLWYCKQGRSMVYNLI